MPRGSTIFKSYATQGNGPASVMQLNFNAKGTANRYLNVRPNFTHWRVRHYRHTNFSMAQVDTAFDIRTNQPVNVEIERDADLIYYTFIEFDLPGIAPLLQDDADAPGFGMPIGKNQFCTLDPTIENATWWDTSGDSYIDPRLFAEHIQDADQDIVPGFAPPSDQPYWGDNWCHWTNAIGQFLVGTVSMKLGTAPLDTLYNDYLFMWEELSGKPGKRLTEMIGRRETRLMLIQESQAERTLYVPLPFYYTQNSGCALPVVSVPFHPVTMTIQLSPFKECIVASSNNFTVVKTTWNKDLKRWVATTDPIRETDITARVSLTYVYLDVEERQKFSAGNFDTLMMQVQSNPVNVTKQTESIELQFNHAVSEIMWAVRRPAHKTCGNHFDYSGFMGKDPVLNAAITLNGNPRVQKEGKWFRLVQPWECHTNIPESFIYVYSFCLHPEDVQPSGSCNMSRVDKVNLILQFQDEIVGEGAEVVIFARNWNVLSIEDGVGSSLFSS